jgi:urease accessory protein
VTTRNVIEVIISDGGALFLLPNPVTCFRSASYSQLQTFRLSRGASVVLLDWITSGRKSLGEEWVFSRYQSINEVWVDDKRIARDVLLLEDHQVDTKLLPPRSLYERLAPYSCYANLILYGPLVQNTIRDLSAEYEPVSVLKTCTPADFIWSLSPFAKGKGCIVRVAGKETGVVKSWLRSTLQAIETVVGIDVYRNAFT